MIFSALATYKQADAYQTAASNKYRMGADIHNEMDKEASDVDYNANVADLQAKDAVIRGAEEEQRFRQKVRGTIGAQRTAFAANNIEVSYGSAVDVQADTATQGELDALTIRTNAAREAWGYKVEAHNYRAKAEQIRRQADLQKKASDQESDLLFDQATNTWISGIGSMVGKAYSYGGGGK